MKKLVLVVMAFLFVSLCSFGQAWEWVRTGISDGTDVSNEVCVDNSGNVYVLGETTSSEPIEISFGTQILTSDKERFGFLVKYNSNGDFIWAVNMIESDDGYYLLRGITTDDEGSVVIVGLYDNSIFIAGIELESLGSTDTFIAKFNSDGEIVWVKSGGGPYSDQAYDVVSDGQNYYMVAGFVYEASFGEIDLLAVSPNVTDEIALAKYDSNGDVVWAIRAGGLSYDNPTGIAYDGSKLFVTGYLSSRDADFGTTILDCEGITNVFLTQIDPTTGVFDWAKVFETGHGGVGAIEKQGPHIEVDDNSIYMAGYYRDKFIFSGDVTLAEDGDNAFIASFSKSGDLNWINEITTTTDETPFPYSMSYADGNVYIVGQYMNNITTDDYELIGTQAGGVAITLRNAYIFSYAANGNLNWGESVNAYLDYIGGQMNINSVSVDGDFVYTAGAYGKTVQIGGFEFSSEHSIDIFFGKINILGNSIASNNAEISCNVFPNPGSNNIMINLDASVIDSYSIVDLSGKEIISKKNIANNSIINIAELNSGVYFLQIDTNNGRIVKKIIKK